MAKQWTPAQLQEKADALSAQYLVGPVRYKVPVKELDHYDSQFNACMLELVTDMANGGDGLNAFDKLSAHYKAFGSEAPEQNFLAFARMMIESASKEGVIPMTGGIPLQANIKRLREATFNRIRQAENIDQVIELARETLLPKPEGVNPLHTRPIERNFRAEMWTHIQLPIHLIDEDRIIDGKELTQEDIQKGTLAAAKALLISFNEVHEPLPNESHAKRALRRRVDIFKALAEALPDVQAFKDLSDANNKTLQRSHFSAGVIEIFFGNTMANMLHSNHGAYPISDGQIRELYLTSEESLAMLYMRGYPDWHDDIKIWKSALARPADAELPAKMIAKFGLGSIRQGSTKSHEEALRHLGSVNAAFEKLAPTFGLPDEAVGLRVFNEEQRALDVVTVAPMQALACCATRDSFLPLDPDRKNGTRISVPDIPKAVKEYKHLEKDFGMRRRKLDLGGHAVGRKQIGLWFSSPAYIGHEWAHSLDFTLDDTPLKSIVDDVKEIAAKSTAFYEIAEREDKRMDPNRIGAQYGQHYWRDPREMFARISEYFFSPAGVLPLSGRVENLGVALPAFERHEPLKAFTRLSHSCVQYLAEKSPLNAALQDMVSKNKEAAEEAERKRLEAIEANKDVVLKELEFKENRRIELEKRREEMKKEALERKLEVPKAKVRYS